MGEISLYVCRELKGMLIRIQTPLLQDDGAAFLGGFWAWSDGSEIRRGGFVRAFGAGVKFKQGLGLGGFVDLFDLGSGINSPLMLGFWLLEHLRFDSQRLLLNLEIRASS